MRHSRPQSKLLIMIILIVAIILFRMFITRAGDAAIEKLDKEKRQREEVQERLDAKEDPLVEELQRRIDAAHDPLEELKPKVSPVPEPEATSAPTPLPSGAQPETSEKSSSR